MIIRDLRPEDVPEVHGINQAEVPAVSSVTSDELGRLVALSVIALVADPGAGPPVGFCLVLPPGVDYASPNYRWWSARADRFVYLDRIAIRPDHQGRGLGRRLYAEVERLSRARRPDAELFTLEVNIEPRNDASLAFHDRLGFTEAGRQSTGQGDDTKVVSMMSKILSGRADG